MKNHIKNQEAAAEALKALNKSTNEFIKTLESLTGGAANVKKWNYKRIGTCI